MSTNPSANDHGSAELLDGPAVMIRPEVSAITRISMPTLARWATESPPRGPKFKKAGGRVLYMRSDVIAWLESL